ncbi:inward rectifier potassium channel [Thermoflavifilum aggregans]|uniref:Inward rectifier potassium channel n=1 Tax=Thermoflavifilum aggregans TaxID=454188 RepID=A0A2M9CRP4_9BACT|nr:ion channel [Thermoflavifilum aggregans]PJJ74600.1 inward rectifier potassium channel [Thermoflavifilum aggregans]
MALRKRINPRSILNPDTGFGSNPSSYGGRFLNKDGSYNLIKRGIPFFTRISVFQSLIAMPLWAFIGIIMLFFITINLLFALLYMALGTQHLNGMVSRDFAGRFSETFFFSAQTLTTVGYGHVSPLGFWTSLTASFEALCGLMTFAIVTGLVYGRFARPRAYLRFSKQALIAPYQDGVGLMFRMVCYKDQHNLIDASVRVNLGFNVEEHGKQVYKFYALNLERYRIDTLNMNWTVVHPIDENSPLRGFTAEDLAHAEAELYVQVSGFDEVFSTTVVQKTSYTFDEIIFGARFVPMYHESPAQSTTILDVDKLDVYEKVQLPQPLA